MHLLMNCCDWRKRCCTDVLSCYKLMEHKKNIPRPSVLRNHMCIFYYNGSIKYLEHETKKQADCSQRELQHGMEDRTNRIAAYDHGVGVPLGITCGY